MTAPASTPDPATGLTREDLRRAALSVCRYAAEADLGTDGARDLLEALGLLDDLRGTQTLAS